MAVSFSNAINAYNSAARSVAEGRPEPALESGQGSAFASLVKDSLREAKARLRDTEDRLNRLEAAILSEDFQLRRKFRDIG